MWDIRIENRKPATYHRALITNGSSKNDNKQHTFTLKKDQMVRVDNVKIEHSLEIEAVKTGREALRDEFTREKQAFTAYNNM